jgi:prophage tail gpP-like protein
VPKPSEVAEVTIQGQRYRDWESVLVYMEEGSIPNSFKLSVSEGKPLASKFAEMRIKPGDHCTVTLAGELAISGFVETRQVAYTGTQHGVEILGHSLNKAAVDASVVHSTMEFKDKPLVPIAQELCKPLGIKFVPLTQISNKPFPRLNIPPGATVYETIETLCRQRGVIMGTDLQGNITARMQFTGGGDKLIEGVNILEGREVLTMSMGGSDGTSLYNYGQKSGTDKEYGAKVAHDPQGKTVSKSPGIGRGIHAPQVSTSEHPVDKKDAQSRTDTEDKRRDYEKFEVTIVVQGWIKPSGGLWKPGSWVHVKSPMLIVDEPLKLMKAQFTQDNKSGTRTSLELTRDTGGGNGKWNYDPASKTGGISDASDPSGGGKVTTPA